MQTYNADAPKKKYRRVVNRNERNFPDFFWKVGYEFEGVPQEIYNQVEEYEDGKLVRIHVMDQLEQI